MAFPLQGRTAILTGAASGIGAALAGVLARRGVHLALADRDAVGLETSAAAARRHGVRVSEHEVDLSDKDAVAMLPEAVLREHDHVHVLVNNAGVALAGSFAEVAMADIEWLFAINFWAPVYLTRAFMFALAREPAAHIVNVSSMFGLVAPPGQAAYCASKFALRGFSEALRHELEGSGVSLTVVHPGGVRTQIANSARMPQGIDPELARVQTAAFNKLLRTPPEEAAELIARAIERQDRRLLIGGDARMADRLQRLFPATYWSYIRRQIKGDIKPAALVGEGSHG